MAAVFFFFAAAALGLAWLAPNHDMPWICASNDGAAIFGLLLLLAHVLAQKQISLATPKPVLALLVVACACAVTQRVFGVNLYWSDLLLPLFYFFCFGLAIVVGRNLSPEHFLILMRVLLGALFLSSVIGIMQWLQMADGWNIYISGNDGSRVWGNVNQPNNFGSLCALGLALGFYLLWQAKPPRLFTLFLLMGTLGVAGVLSGSRTFLLQFSCLILGILCLSAWLRSKSPVAQKSLGFSLALLAFVLLFYTALPYINDALLLLTTRSAESTLGGGSVRLYIWKLFSIAFWQKPWLGYGWQQLGWAHLEATHSFYIPAMNGVIFTHAHNLVLDNLVSSGLFFGSALVGLFFLLVWRAGQAAWRNQAAMSLYFGVLALVLHAMVELPLDYAFLFIPLGLILGHLLANPLTSTSMSAPTSAFFSIPRVWVGGAGLVMAVFFAFLTRDYLLLVQAQSTLQFESAHIGTQKIVTPPPKLFLLNQQAAYLKLGQTEDLQHISPGELNALVKAAMRFPFPLSLIRASAILDLHGRHTQAQDLRDAVCRINAIATCNAAHITWQKMRAHYPQLPAW